MADEQTPQSDLIDDAIRNAERQLEAKLEALRMSALGETTAHTPDAAPDDVAVLRPTGAASASSDDSSWSTPEIAPTPPRLDAEPANGSAGGVSGITPSWDDDRPAPAGPVPSSPAPYSEPEPDLGRPEPVHASWTGGASHSSPPPEPRRTAPPVAGAAPAGIVETVPSEEEMQFWAQTRTALRNIQQVSETLPTQVSGNVVGEMERIVRDELAAPNATLRMLQQGVQQGLPKVAERLEAALREEVEAPTTAIRQVQEELPSQLDRVTRDVTSSVAGEVDRMTGAVQGSITRDVGQLEQSIATNVTRMAQGLGEGVSRVERGMGSLEEAVGRSERGVRSEFDRVEASLRTAIDEAQAMLRDDLVQPTETVRKLDDELPARFARIERTLLDEVSSTRAQLSGELNTARTQLADDVAGSRQHVSDQVTATRRDLSDVLASLVDANRAALDRLSQVTTTLEQDRTQRGEDLEFLVDTMTTGWEGMAKAVTSLFAQGEEANQRITVLEERLVAAAAAMEGMERHVLELQPAPVMVTVNHPDATISQVTKGGYLIGGAKGE